MKASERGFSAREKSVLVQKAMDEINATFKHPVWVNWPKFASAVEVVRRNNRRVSVQVPLDTIFTANDAGWYDVDVDAVKAAINAKVAELNAK